MRRIVLLKNKPRGMTLVEFMVAIGITAIVMTFALVIFSNQYKSYSTIQDAHEIQEDLPTVLYLLRRDIMEAGWSVKPEMAFYFEDGGNDSPDKIYLNDTSLIDGKNPGDTAIMTSRDRSDCPGGRKVKNISSYNINIDFISINSDNEINDFGSENLPTTNSGYIITDIINDNDKKTAYIDSVVDNETIKSDKIISGAQYVAPAKMYEVNHGEDWTLRLDTQETSGAQPIVNQIVDMQVAYRIGSTWHCDNNTGASCPADPFDPTKIDLVRLTLVTRGKHQNVSASADADRYCRPGVENRSGGGDCGYKYRTHTLLIKPRNN